MGAPRLALADTEPKLLTVTKRTLEQRELSRIPGTNGDALRSIQSLPGVARPPGLAGLLLVFADQHITVRVRQFQDGDGDRLRCERLVSPVGQGLIGE